HREIAPRRTVGEKLVASEKPTKDLRHSVGRLAFVQPPKPCALEGFRVGLENPGRASRLVLIGMGNEGTPFGFLEDEGEGIEWPRRPHPGEHIGANIDLRLEMVDIFFAEG